MAWDPLNSKRTIFAMRPKSMFVTHDIDRRRKVLPSAILGLSIVSCSRARQKQPSMRGYRLLDC